MFYEKLVSTLFRFPMFSMISTGMYTGASRPPVILYLFSYNRIFLHLCPQFSHLVFSCSFPHSTLTFGVCFPILSKMSAHLSFIVFASFLSSPSVCSHDYPAFHRVRTTKSLFSSGNAHLEHRQMSHLLLRGETAGTVVSRLWACHWACRRNSRRCKCSSSEEIIFFIDQSNENDQSRTLLPNAFMFHS